MQTHPSTIHRRGSAPVSHTHGIEVTDQDILDTIAQITGKQTHGRVSIATLAISLGFNADDRDWLIGTLKVLETEGSIMLSSVPHPEHLALYQAHWYVRNATGKPCHEVALALQPSQRLAPLLSRQSPELPLYRPEADSSTDNPTMQKRRISDLVKGAADTFFGKGSRPHTQYRVLHVEHNQPGEAA